MSHISCVQTLVKARGKNSSRVFFLPRLLLSFTSTRPEGCLDLRLKSGALDPTGNGICLFSFGFSILVNDPVIRFPSRTCQTTIIHPPLTPSRRRQFGQHLVRV